MKPLIALCGLFYPVAILRYFENALLRRNDIDLVTVGPDFGVWLPWKAGMHLPYTVRVVDIPIPQVTNGRPPVSFAEAKLRGKLGRLPDVWLQIDAGHCFQGKPSEGLNIVAATDPHCLNYDYQRSIADIFYCMQTPYMKEGDSYFPYAYDSEWHRFIGGVEKHGLRDYGEPKFHAALCGLTYKSRQDWANALRSKGYNVFLDTGPSYNDARKIYASSVTGFNWSSLQDTVARCFELMAMGIPSPMNRVPDLLRLFEDGEHFLGFDDLSGAVQASVELIENPELQENIWVKARRAVEPHTYDARIFTILGDADLV